MGAVSRLGDVSPLGEVLRARGTVYLLGTSLVGRLPTAMAALAIVQLVRLQGGGYTLAGSHDGRVHRGRRRSGSRC